MTKQIQFPHTIQNCLGEKLTFIRLEQDSNGDKLIVENEVLPGVGPVMHTHFFQDEALTVVSGKVGYQISGQAPQFAEVGETVVFKRGTPHRFWNAGNEILHCKGYIQPANNIIYFLSGIFNAQNKTGSERPEIFDSAFLLTRYASEFDMTEMPFLIKKVVLPITFAIGKLTGKYDHFADAPPACTA
ncbi:MAG TPA: cupin domain-containing protein [Saprospiraceae bacterium]|nr:cupin domain-containing protein [Saprospiraceae bacterium]